MQLCTNLANPSTSRSRWGSSIKRAALFGTTDGCSSKANAAMVKAINDALAAARKGNMKAFLAARAQIQSQFAVTMVQVRQFAVTMVQGRAPAPAKFIVFLRSRAADQAPAASCAWRTRARAPTFTQDPPQGTTQCASHAYGCPHSAPQAIPLLV